MRTITIVPFNLIKPIRQRAAAYCTLRCCSIFFFFSFLFFPPFFKRVVPNEQYFVINNKQTPLKQAPSSNAFVKYMI